MAEPKLRFPEFKDSWELHNLGDFAKEIKRVEKDSEAPVMMISSGNGFIYQADRYSRDNAGSSLKKYIELHKDEFAYNHGYSKAKIYGSVFMLTEEEKARIPYVYHCFSIDNAHKPFLARLLNRNQLNKELVKYITSTARMDGLLNISFEDFMKVEFFIPSEEEQRKVADTLIAVDELISTLTEEVRLWEEKKKGVMQKIFSQEIRFKDENGEDYPEWESYTFSEIASLGKEKYNPNTGVRFKCIELEHMDQTTGTINGYVNSDEQNSIKNKFYEGDVLFGKLRPYLRKYHKPNFEGVCSSEIWVLKPSELITTAYLYCLVSTDEFIALSNVTSGTKMPRADWSLISNAVFDVPSIDEQQKIASCIEGIDEVISIKKQKLETWKNIKKGLLQQMFV